MDFLCDYIICAFSTFNILKNVTSCTLRTHHSDRSIYIFFKLAFGEFLMSNCLMPFWSDLIFFLKRSKCVFLKYMSICVLKR